MVLRKLPEPVNYTVTASGGGQLILGSRYRVGTPVRGNPNLLAGYVRRGYLTEPAQPKSRGRKRNELHDVGRTEPEA